MLGPTMLGATMLGATMLGGCQSPEETPLLPAAPQQKRDGMGQTPLPGRSPSSPAEVKVELLAPMPDEVLPLNPAPEVKVRVRSVVPKTEDAAADPIDPATVRMVLGASALREPLVKGLLTSKTADNLYTGRLDLAAVETGAYMLSVEALTRGGRRGLAMTQVRVDRGPKIKILSPRPGQPVKGSVTVQVQVDYTPFEHGGAPMATVAFQPVALREVGPSLFETVLDFAKFNPPLTGEQLLSVTAQGQQGTKSDASVLFTVDHVGPTITDTSPPPGAVVGQVIELRAVIQDPAGVQGGTVTAVIGHKGGGQAFTLMLKPQGPGVYSALFDTARLRTCASPPADGTLCTIFPNVSFRAADQLGNETTVAYDLHVDNQGPIIELDPEPIRLLKFEAGGYMCSHAFRPNGNYTRPGSAPNDLCRVPQTFDLRAWAEDVGNPSYDQRGAPFAAIDPTTVAAYVQQDTSPPLVVDTDGDGWCDSINPKLEPTTRGPLSQNQVLKVRLGGIPMRGKPDFSPLADLPVGCLPKSEQAPDAVCTVFAPSRDTIAIGHPDILKGPYPSIWTLEPVTDGSPFCLGAQFDTFANEIRAPGWVCMAVAARDAVGNLGVSKPLRLWVDRTTVPFPPPQSGCLGPPANAPPPPSCVGTYSVTDDTVTTRACRSRRFAFVNNRREFIVGSAVMSEK